MAEQRRISEITASPLRLPDVSQRADADQTPPALYSWPQMIGRVFLYFALGCGFNAIVTRLWLELMAATYGNIDDGLKIPTRGVPAVLSLVYFAAITASFFGGFAGPLWLGRIQCRRLTTLASSALGAVIGTAAASGFAFSAIWLCEQAGLMRREFAGVLIGTLVFGALMGVLGGWLASRIALRWERRLKTPSPPANTHPR